MPNPILLVIPCYHERERLPRFLPHLLEALTRSRLPVEVLVVDDGSDAEHQAWVKLYAVDLQRRFPILRPALCLPENVGKGGAVYAGWASAGAGHAWLGLVDADGAVSVEEMVRILQLLPATPDRALWAVRTGTEGTQVRRVWKRQLSGTVFRFLTRRLFGFPVPDTQCGCKLLPQSTFAQILPQLSELRFCFDIELTFRVLSTGLPIQSVPIDWEESPGSRLGPHSVYAMFLNLLRLRQRLGKWTSGKE